MEETIYVMIMLMCSVKYSVSCSDQFQNGRTICLLGSDGVLSEGDTCVFICNTGYRLTGNETRTCQSNGNWSGSDARCVNVSCHGSSLYSPTHGGKNCSESEYYLYGTVCIFTCNTGYELTGSNSRTCLSDGSWSNCSTRCRRVSCPSLPPPNNGNISNCSNYYGDSCSFTCNTGYELTGSSQRTCQSDGIWNGSEVSCSIMECSSSSLPMNSMLVHCYNSTYTSICNLQCEEGFVGRGNPLYECNVFSGEVTWRETGSSWNCIRVTCLSLTYPNNGMINCSLGDDGVPSYEDTCSFTCNTGYELTGCVTRTCQSDGSWSGSETTCSRVSCPSVIMRNPSNGIFICSLGDDEVTSFEDTCNFTCNTGYELTGSDNRTCQSDGSWSGSETNCSRVNCRTLSYPNNGIMNCFLGDDGVPSYEDTCSFTCNTGYELTGSDTRTCQSNGSWSDIETTCTVLVDDSSAIGVTVGGAVGGIVFLLIATAMLLLTIVWMRRKLQMHNSKSSKDNNSTVPGSGVPTDPNSSNDVTKPVKENDEDIFGWFGERPSRIDPKHHVKMNANPSYEKVTTEERNTTDSQVTTGSNVAIIPNPAYGGVA